MLQGGKARSLRTSRAPTAAMALALLAGCSSTVPPKLRVENARVAERTDQGLVLDFILEADNANEEALPLREIRYDVFVGGRRVFSGTRSSEATLRRFGTQTMRLPAVIALEPGQSAPAGAEPYRIQGELTYLAPGAIAEALFENDVSRPTAAFSGDGQVDLSAAPTRP